MTPPRPFWPTALALLGASVLFCLPLFGQPDNWGRQDWDQFTFRYETPRVALLRDHQLPAWNPYAAGGNVLLAHPDVPVLSPWYAIVLALGAPAGLRVQVLVFMAIGAIGMAALTRRLGASDLGAAAAGVAFMMSSHFVLHITEGHLEWCVLALMPWVACCILQQTRRAVIGAALIFASGMTFGAVYVPAIFLPFMSAWMTLEAIRHRRMSVLTGWGAFLVLAVGISLPKILPVVAFTSAHPRVPVAGVDAPLRLWPTMFGDPRQGSFYQAYRDRELPEGHFAKVLSDDDAEPFLATIDDAGLQFGFHEFGCYLGVAGIVLAVVGIAASARRLWPLYGAGILAALVIMGANGPVNLFALLQELPLYQQLRVPSRFLMAVVFVLAVAVAFGVTRIAGSGIAHSRRRLIAAITLTVAMYGELLGLGWSMFRDVFVVPPVPLETHADFAQRCDGKPSNYEHVIDSAMVRCLQANSGDLDAYENLTVTRGRVRLTHDPDYRGEAYLEEGGDAIIRRWTMSRVDIHVRSRLPTRLVLNQNFADGWRAMALDAQGTSRELTPLRSGEGLVSVPVDPLVTSVTLFYEAKGFRLGVAIGVPILLSCIGFLVVSTLRRGKGGAELTGPLRRDGHPK